MLSFITCTLIYYFFPVLISAILRARPSFLIMKKKKKKPLNSCDELVWKGAENYGVVAYEVKILS